MHNHLTLPSAEPEKEEKICFDFVNGRFYVSVTTTVHRKCPLISQLIMLNFHHLPQNHVNDLCRLLACSLSQFA